MKKIFTLIAMATMAVSANAQTESYLAVGSDGNASTEFLNPVVDGTDLVVTATTANVTMKAVASKTPDDIEDASGAGLNQDSWTAWKDANWNTVKKQGDINFSWIQGTGNPYISFIAEQKSKDGDLLDAYKAQYTYYEPDGSLGLPNSGEYVEFTAKKDGMFKIGFWCNKGGSRKLYLVRKSDKKALQWDADESKTEYKVEGYIQGADDTTAEQDVDGDGNPRTDGDGNPVYKKKKKYFTYMIVTNYVPGLVLTEEGGNGNLEYVDAGTGETKTVASWNQPKFGWFVFDAKADETYMIFGADWQFGLQGFEFTPGATQKDYQAQDPAGINIAKTTPNSNATIYNLAGQKVSDSFKGIVIQNGKKFVK